MLGSNFIDNCDVGLSPEDVRPKRRKRKGKGTWCGCGKDPDADGAPFHPENIRWENGPLGQRSSVAQVLMLSGFKVHAMYWDLEDMHDVGCIRPIVSRMLQTEPRLATPASAPKRRGGPKPAQ